MKAITTPASQITQQKKELFVDSYQKLLGHIGNTCRAVGISRKTYYNWLENDSNFTQSILELEMDLNDDIREVLIQKAAEGDMTAVIFYLKKRHPDFKDQPNILIQQNFSKVLSNEREEFKL
jgi:hypothetical protein